MFEAARDYRAGYQLYLMEEYERQDDAADLRDRKQDAGHGHA